MATEIIKVTILLRRDTFNNWKKNNPILQIGEMSYVTDIGKCKVGDGQTRWNDLPFFILETDLNEQAKIIIKTKSAWVIEGRKESKKGVIYVYTDDDPTSRVPPKIKIGDGLAYISDLPFVTDEVMNKIQNHAEDLNLHVTEAQRQFWNSKVTAYMLDRDSGNLILDDGTLIL